MGIFPSPQESEILQLIESKVSIFPYFRSFSGSFKGETYKSDRPPRKAFLNNTSCKPFVQFIQRTLLERMENGAVSLVGKVGVVEPPYLVLPLTVEPSKPRLCHDARFLNLWMTDKPFSLDSIMDLPRYVSRDSFQTVLDDKSGYDHILLTNDSRTFFGIQWGGWYFTYNTLPFGWKISPFIYHSTGLVATNFFRSLKIPCLLYIDDRHNGQLQVPLDSGAYLDISDDDGRRFAAAKSALFIVAYYLISLGYFLGLKKSILKPEKVVPYLGFLADSSLEVFHLIPEKKLKFLQLIREVLQAEEVSVKTLQRLVGKCVSFSKAVPAAQLFTREMNAAISRGLRTSKPVRLCGVLREEVSHWLFLEEWDDPLPWRDERHSRVSVATDASNTGWGGTLVSPLSQEASDYWSREEQSLDISTKEAVAVERALLAFHGQVKNSWVDVSVDNQAVVHSWNNYGGRSRSLNNVMKRLFFTTSALNVSLHLSYIPSAENPADLPSRRLSAMDSQLCPALWEVVQCHFGGPDGHTCDLMSLDTNAMRDKSGRILPHFTLFPSPGSSGVNFFSQNLSSGETFLERPYVFPPLVLVGPVLRHLKNHRRSCTVVVLDVYPRKYWWPLVQCYSVKSLKLARKGDTGALFIPSKKGWVPHSGIPGDLVAFAVKF